MPPVMPAAHDIIPQCAYTHESVRWTPSANVRYHFKMPWRRNPEHSEMNAITRITRFVSSLTMMRTGGSAGPSSPLDASATSNFGSPASSGVLRTTSRQITKNTASTSAGDRNSHAGEVSDAIFGAQSNAKYSPSEIRMPKMPPNVPRSRRWNHDALTLTIATAPKLWKYMFAQNSVINTPYDGAAPSPATMYAPIAKLQAAAPAAATRIANRPPSRSVIGPLSRNARP